MTAVDTTLAVDGIDEMCDVFIPSADHPIGGDGETLHLHATDAQGDWLLTMHPDRIDVTREPAEADAALHGTARDLLLIVWGREPIGEVEHLGDEAVIRALQLLAKID